MCLVIKLVFKVFGNIKLISFKVQNNPFTSIKEEHYSEVVLCLKFL